MASKRPIITRDETRKFADRTSITVEHKFGPASIGGTYYSGDSGSERSNIILYKDIPGCFTSNAIDETSLKMLMSLNSNLKWKGLDEYMRKRFFENVVKAEETYTVSITKHFEYKTKKKNGEPRSHIMEAVWRLDLSYFDNSYSFFQSIDHSIYEGEALPYRAYTECGNYHISRRRDSKDINPIFDYRINGTKSGADIPFSYEFPEGMHQSGIFGFNEVFVKIPPDGDLGSTAIGSDVLTHCKKDMINIVRPFQYSFTAMQQFALQQYLEKYNSDKSIIII